MKEVRRFMFIYLQEMKWMKYMDQPHNEMLGNFRCYFEKGIAGKAKRAGMNTRYIFS